MSIRLPGSLLLITGFIASMILSFPLMAGVIAAPKAIAQSASSVNEVHSDFNGDGYEDLAIGTIHEDIDGIDSAGAVNVLYGSSFGFQTSSPADQFWHQNSPSVKDLAEVVDERFGSSLAHGDFNNDGFADLAIGVPFEDIGSVDNAGAVHILYGSVNGLQANSPDDQFWNQNSAGLEDLAENDDYFGYSLATGDFNADSFDDLAIGVIGEEVVGTTSEGAVNVLYGSSQGLSTSTAGDSTGRVDQLWHQNSPGVEETSEFLDQFGVSLAAGDFNNDGRDDLAVGVVGESLGSIITGAVNVLYGSFNGLQVNSPADQLWHQDSLGVEDANEDGESFGGSLVAGDFNNDEFDDLAIGNSAEGLGTAFNQGAITVLYGSSMGLQTTSPADQFWHQNSPSVQDDAESSDYFGSIMTSGDLNGDGYFDLAIGISSESILTGGGQERLRAGAVSVLYGSASGLQATSPNDQFWHQNSPGVEDSVGFHEFFGLSVASGDFNGDGIHDLAIGVPAEDIGTVSEAGAINVLYGSLASGLQTSSPVDQLWNQNSAGVNDAAEEFDSFGHTLS